MKRISTKQEFYALSRRDMLGNTLTQWDWATYQKLFLETPEELPFIVGVRHVMKSFTAKGNSTLQTRKDAFYAGMTSLDRDSLLFDEAAPHEDLTIQGEIMADHEGLYVRYSDLQVHQRVLWEIERKGLIDIPKHMLPCNVEILTEEQRTGNVPVLKHARGLQAVEVLRQYMDVMSYEMTMDLLECQRINVTSWHNLDHPIIEFACFNHRLGRLKWNTLFWEVRTHY